MVHFSFGVATDPSCVKYKIEVKPRADGALHDSVKLTLAQYTAALRQLVTFHVATDRGHNHSSGTSIICFWIGQSFQVPAAACPADRQDDSSCSVFNPMTPEFVPRADSQVLSLLPSIPHAEQFPFSGSSTHFGDLEMVTGQKIDILYAPDDPQSNMSVLELNIFLKFSFIFGFVAIVAGLMSLRFRKPE